jgi:hypothetical protein
MRRFSKREVYGTARRGFPFVNDHPRGAMRISRNMSKDRKAESPKRARRNLNGMAETAGLPAAPHKDEIMSTVALLNAALRLWEARNAATLAPSPWQRKARAKADEAAA